MDAWEKSCHFKNDTSFSFATSEMKRKKKRKIRACEGKVKIVKIIKYYFLFLLFSIQNFINKKYRK